VVLANTLQHASFRYSKAFLILEGRYRGSEGKVPNISIPQVLFGSLLPKSRSPPLTQLLVCLTLPVSGIQLRMVNFHDPTVVAIDNRAYSFGSSSGILQHNDCIFFESCDFEALARCEWPLSVGLLDARKISLTRRVISQLGVLHDSRL
jgi:hypothetical protein